MMENLLLARSYALRGLAREAYETLNQIVLEELKMMQPTKNETECPQCHEKWPECFCNRDLMEGSEMEMPEGENEDDN